MTLAEMAACRADILRAVDELEDRMVGEMLLQGILNGNEKSGSIAKTMDIIETYLKERERETNDPTGETNKGS